MISIQNAAPNHYMIGTKDGSGSTVNPAIMPIPQHLPKFYLFTSKGPTEPVLCNGPKATLLYDVESFNKLNKYRNHSTLFAESIMNTGNTVMIQRVIPEDAGPEANFTIYIDIIEDDVPNYLRNANGTLVSDGVSGYLVDEDKKTIKGHRIKFIKEVWPDGIKMGEQTIKNGTMVDADGNPSTMYPMMDFKAKYKGEAYNNVGITINSKSQKKIISQILTDGDILPYELKEIYRADKYSSLQVNKSLYGEIAVDFTFKENGLNPVTSVTFDMNSVMPSKWSNEIDTLLPLKYSDYAEPNVYYSHIEAVLKKIMTLEKDYVSYDVKEWHDGITAATTSWFDFNSVDPDRLTNEELHLFNIVGLKSTKNVRFFTAIADETAPSVTDTQTEIFLNEDSPIYLECGSDGTLSFDTHEELVIKEMEKYVDPDSSVMDTAINVESIIYDTGFRLEGKKALCNFIALRKDTIVALTTHDSTLGKHYAPLSDERAMAINLKTMLKLTPESDYFGTPVSRGIIVAGAGVESTGFDSTRIPLLLELAIKSAEYMGSGDGIWKADKRFDGAPGNIINTLIDVQPSFVPNGVKPVLWNNGMVWAEPFDRRRYFFPGLQTVYNNDTSVLNSYLTVSAICTINKVAGSAWREFSGNSRLSKSEMITSVTSFVNKKLSGIFDNRFTITPEVMFTGLDDKRGYSWTLVTKIKANVMRTVMISSVEAERV